MTKILDSLAISIPKGLQNKVFVDIGIYFANRGRDRPRPGRKLITRISNFEGGVV